MAFVILTAIVFRLTPSQILQGEPPMKRIKSEQGSGLIWAIVIFALIILIGYIVYNAIINNYQKKVVVNVMTEYPVALVFVRDGATPNPQALLMSLAEENSCIPADCVMALLPGKFAVSEVFTDTGDSVTGEAVGIGVQIRWFKNKDTTAMSGHLPYFSFVALSQFDSYGMQTGKSVLSNSWLMATKGKPNMDPGELLLSYWDELVCHLAFLNADIPCNETGWWPEEQGTWLFPVTQSNTATASDVYVIKMNSSGSMSLFSIDSEFITFADIQYISEHRPEATGLLKLFYAEKLFDVSISTPIP